MDPADREPEENEERELAKVNDDETNNALPACMKTTRKPKPEGDAVYSGRWTEREHEMFLLGLRKYGREWKKVASLIKTRTSAQVILQK